MTDGKAVPGPSRFTMLVAKRGDEWCIAHHHSHRTCCQRTDAVRAQVVRGISVVGTSRHFAAMRNLVATGGLADMAKPAPIEFNLGVRALN